MAGKIQWGKKDFFDVINAHKSYDRVVVAAVWLILAHSFGINSVSVCCGYKIYWGYILTITSRCLVYF